jgi:hypothetical protein
MSGEPPKPIHRVWYFLVLVAMVVLMLVATLPDPRR